MAFAYWLVSGLLAVTGAPEGASPLHAAARAGDLEELEARLDGGAPIDAREPLGRTALHAASEAGRLDAAALLLARGARVAARNLAGLTPLHLAANADHLGVAALLLANCAPVDARDRDGRTPLHLAAARGHVVMAEILLEEGAELDARRPHGSTPLSVALGFGHGELAELLRGRGAQPVFAASLPEPEAELDALPPVSAPPPAALPRDPVERAQHLLDELGYDPGPVDGRVGRRTSAAIERFQSDVGQIADGEVSRCLLERLERELEPPDPPDDEADGVSALRTR